MINDKNKELGASIKLVNDKLHFIGSASNNDPISIDYIPPLGDNLGYTSLELMLLSISSCLGSAVLTFLRRMNKTINDFKINSRGIRKTEHPTGFEFVDIEICITSVDTTANDMEKVIELAEDKYCPVISMIKGNTKVRISYQIFA